ncbi:MAG: hypothetical protein OHK0029_25980 [Armatimonadaceae bacterium]
MKIPTTVTGYQSQGDDVLTDKVRAELASADVVSRTYLNANGQNISFILIGGTDRTALHDPRSCLVGAGWKIQNDRLEMIPGTNVNARTCRMVRDGSQESYEVIYLYVVNNQIVNQATQIRFQMMLSALIGQKHTPALFVRFLRPVQTDPQADAASREQFMQFTATMWNTIRPDEYELSKVAEAETRSLKNDG